MAFAKAVTLLGDSGAGQLAKMVNQICIAGLVQGLAEAIAFGQKAGLDMKAVLGVIGKGAAQSWQMDNRGKTMIDGQFEFGFAVDWMRKDLGLVLDEAKRNGARLPVTALVDQFYADVQAQGGQRWDTSSLIAQARAEAAGRRRAPGRPIRASARAGAAARVCSVGEFGFADHLEHAHDLCDAADAARDLGRAAGLALGDAAHQVDHAALGDDLVRRGLHVFRVDDARLDLARDQRVVRARADRGRRGDHELVDDRAHVLDARDAPARPPACRPRSGTSPVNSTMPL